MGISNTLKERKTIPKPAALMKYQRYFDLAFQVYHKVLLFEQI